MKLPIAWLRDYLDVSLSSDDIAARLASLGFPVDAIERRTKLSGVQIGRLADVTKHPDADRLQVCTVDVGEERTLTIATAATNVATGDVVPVARLGAELVGLTIGPRKMRGIASEGMLCSAAELGLEGTWFEDGILQLERDLPIGDDFIARYRLNDDVLDVEITANRVDAMSVLGLARELGASLGATVREPATTVARYADDATPANAVSLASSDCRRFVAQRVSNVTVGVAPFWMRVRLALAGQRPIDNVVDISNFVMFEGAQPVHFYDYEKLEGPLVVRDARDGERMRTLDEAERALDARFLVIADDREAQCIAGLKGAAASEVGPQTRELLVEAAAYVGPRVRRMSVALGLRTEASTRHEKGLPPGLSTWGAARAAYLLAAQGATAHAPIAVGADGAIARVALDARRIEALLGIAVDADEAARALRALGFDVLVDGTRLSVGPPPWRGDARIPEDLVEEVARIVGYDRIVAEVPAIFEHGVTSDAYRDERRIAHALAALGYRETYTFALQPAAVAATYARAGVALPGAVVEIVNPLSEDQRYLRFSLVAALLAHAARYAARGERELRTFEIGHAFEGARPDETAGVAWLAALPRADGPAWRDDGFGVFAGESLAFVRALAGVDAELVSGSRPGWHPGKTAAMLVDGRDVAIVGAVDPRLVAAYDIDARVYAGYLRLADLPASRVPTYRPASKFPSIARDLAVVVAPELPARDVEHAVRAGAPDVVASVRVFDEYRGPQIADGKKSLAMRIVLQRVDATMTDADADAVLAAILASLRERCDAIIRA